MTSTRTIIHLLSIFILAAGGVFIWSLLTDDSLPDAPTANKKDRVQLVEVETAARGSIAHSVDLTGEVVATDSVVIRATKEGPIVFCPWREGDEVNSREKLIEIDREVHRAEVSTSQAALEVAQAKLTDLKAGTRPEEIDQAKANVHRWQATLEEARASYERYVNLRAKQFSSQQELDQARERMNVAKAELANAREKLRMLQAGPTRTDIAVQEADVKEAAAKLGLAKAHLAECTMTAPFKAKITRVHVRPGDLATPGNPLLELFDPDSLVIRFSVPEYYAAKVKPDLPLQAKLDALPGQTFGGRVERVYPYLDPEMRTRTVEAKLERTQDLMPNQFARLSLELGAVSDAVIISAKAVLETAQGGKVAYVVQEGTAARRSLRTGIEHEGRIQVVEGIQPGDKVIIKGQQGLKPGTNVRIHRPDQKSGPSGE